MRIYQKIKYLTLILLLTVFGQSFGAWDGSIAETAPETETGADGKTYYLIDSEKKLAWFAAQVNSGKVSYNAKLTANLDMSNPDPSKKSLWTPIAAGNNKNNYNGTFDGNKHVVSNLYISAEELKAKYNNDNNMAQNIGFIGCFSGTVKDLILENIEVHGYGKGGIGNASNLVDKPISIGTVVGWQSVTTSLIDGCYATGVVITSGDGQAVGGIVGNVGGGTVSNCYSAADIYASGLAYVGGIAGYTKSFKATENGVSVNGTVTMESCVYAGEHLSTEGSTTINGKDSSGRVGAIIGYQYKGTVTLSDLYYDAEQFPEGGVGATTAGSTTGNTAPKSDLNSAEVICLLNGGDYNEGACSGADENQSWSMGESGPVLNDYSADGFKIIFNANGGTFAENAISAVKYVKLDYVINDDGITKPSREDFAFIGWSTNKNATEPDQNLGTASGALVVYAIWNPVYTITFSAAPGTFPNEALGVVKTVKVESGKKIAVKDFVVPSFHMDQGVKYSFMGWSTKEEPEEEDALVDEKGLDDLPIATEDMTLYAVWTEATIYTVTFDANGHGPSIANYVKVKNVYVDEKTTALTDDDFEHADGYSLDTEDGSGWCIDSECSAEFNFDTPIKENKTLYAKWKTDEYAITYENMSGASNPNPSKYTVEGLVLADPSWDDAHSFLGWFKDSEFKNKVSGIPAGTTGPLTLYAGWKTVTYSIIYQAGTGGIGSLSPDEKVHDENYVLPDITYTRTGYLQSGWSVTDCGEKVFDFGGVYEDNRDASFYPAWDTITYTIKYICAHDCDNLDETKYPRTYNVESSIGLQNLSSIAGYKFGGWYKESAYTTKISNIQKGSIGNLKLYGKWNVIYNITYVGTDNPNSAKTYTVDESVNFNNPKDRTGYTFGGWYSDAEFENEVTGIEKGSSGDTTFYAKWIPVDYEITYNLDGGTLPEGAPETYTVESAVELPTPTLSGSKFVGWLDSETQNVVTDLPQGSVGDRTLTAQWEESVGADENGVVTFYVYEDGTMTAEIDGDYAGQDEYALGSDVTVESVVLKRSFTAYVPATLTLPFDIDVDNVVNAKFYAFGGISVDENGKKAVEANRVKSGTLTANTPYMVIPTASEIRFKGGVVFRATVDPVATVGTWQFCGTYSYKTVASENVNSIYGISGSAQGTVSQGEFVKFKAGSWFVPMRAYLLNTEVSDKRLARAMYAAPNAGDSKFEILWNEEEAVVVDVPTIHVEQTEAETSVDVEEQTTHFYKTKVSSKIVNMGREYDLKGRQVNDGKKVKGVYYNKKVLK